MYAIKVKGRTSCTPEQRVDIEKCHGNVYNKLAVSQLLKNTPECGYTKSLRFAARYNTRKQAIEDICEPWETVINLKPGQFKW